MKVAVGSDHAGYPAKLKAIEALRELGCDVEDVGTHTEESCDYPDYAVAAAQAVVRKEADLGVLCCGSGIGMSITANKVPGIRAALCHNAYTAHRMAVKGAANAGRGGGFRSVPEVTATNLFLEPGQRSQEDLLERAGDGLFVTSAMGVHMADPISGDFSLGVSGLEIEGGRPGRPVRGVTIAGNLKELLTNIEDVGGDLRFFSSTGAPSVRIAEMMVSGE